MPTIEEEFFDKAREVPPEPRRKLLKPILFGLGCFLFGLCGGTLLALRIFYFEKPYQDAIEMEIQSEQKEEFRKILREEINAALAAKPANSIDQLQRQALRNQVYGVPSHQGVSAGQLGVQAVQHSPPGYSIPNR